LLLSGVVLFVLLCSSSVVSVDASSMWSRTYGGAGDDLASSVIQTSDGGYAIAGQTYSFGAGGSDFWLVKTDESGNMEWNKAYGGTTYDYAYSVIQTSDGGYAVSGRTESFGVGNDDFWLVKADVAGNMQWNKTYGGTNYDYAFSMVQTSDGGYALAGPTGSFGAGGSDFWLVKTDSVGNMEWNMTYGGTGNEDAWSIIQTIDGGYLLAGGTTPLTTNNTDLWLVKTDESGNMEWNQTYGGTGVDYAYSLVATSDGGYAIAGGTNSSDAGQGDFWLVKTNTLGNMQWNKTYDGGTNSDAASSVIQTSDGGYAVLGTRTSFTGDSPFNVTVEQDSWLIKTDASGNMEWNKTLTGYFCSMVATADGGYAIAGGTSSFGYGGGDFWLVKTDEFGIGPEYFWSQAYGGTGTDQAYSVVESPDGGFAITGTTNYTAGSSPFIYPDCLLVKTDALGNMEWNKTYGGAHEEVGRSLVATSDGGYAIAGWTGSFGAGQADVYLVKTDASGSMQWNNTYGGGNFDRAYSLTTTLDGGYAIAGYTESFSYYRQAYLVKTDALGNMQWNKTYGLELVSTPNLAYAEAWSLVATSDGGYAIACYIYTYNPIFEGTCLVKVDASGNIQWNKTFEGRNHASLVATSDGGYAIAGGSLLIKTDELGNMMWNKTYYGTSFAALLATSDGGYALAGGSLLIKTDALGNMQWNKTYVDGSINSLIATSDEGYALAGTTSSFGAGDSDFWLVRTDVQGIYPEYSSWLIPALVLTATAFIIINKKRLTHKSSEEQY
jgi:hypothetical protein